MKKRNNISAGFDSRYACLSRQKMRRGVKWPELNGKGFELHSLLLGRRWELGNPFGPTFIL